MPFRANLARRTSEDARLLVGIADFAGTAIVDALPTLADLASVAGRNALITLADITSAAGVNALIALADLASVAGVNASTIVTIFARTATVLAHPVHACGTAIAIRAVIDTLALTIAGLAPGTLVIGTAPPLRNALPIAAFVSERTACSIAHDARAFAAEFLAIADAIAARVVATLRVGRTTIRTALILARRTNALPPGRDLLAGTGRRLRRGRRPPGGLGAIVQQDAPGNRGASQPQEPFQHTAPAFALGNCPHQRIEPSIVHPRSFPKPKYP